MANYYGLNPANIDFCEKDGKDFENTMVRFIKMAYQTNPDYGIIIPTIDEDTKEGTDLIISRHIHKDTINKWIMWCRLDSTLNFENKKYMPYIRETDIPATSNTNFQMGIRIGNRHKKIDKNGNTVYSKQNQPIYEYTNFSQPVVVIGVTMNSDEYNKNKDEIAENIRTNATKLINMARRCYVDYVTTIQQDVEKLQKSPLKPNPKFRKPKEIEDRYNDIHEFRKNLLQQGDNNETSKTY